MRVRVLEVRRWMGNPLNSAHLFGDVARGVGEGMEAGAGRLA
jgi:hypothetical protein